MKESSSDRGLKALRRHLSEDPPIGGGLLLFAAALLLSLSMGRSMSGLFWASLILLTGLGISGFLRKRPRILLATAFIAVGAVGIGVVLFSDGPSEPAHLRQISLPGGDPAPRWTRLIPERDVALLSIPWVTMGRENEGLAEALTEIYNELDRDAPFRETTQLRTFFGFQNTNDSDAFVRVREGSDRWLIFLHGFGGNTVAACWVVADAAADVGWNTLCPSTGLSGRWDRGEGPEIFDTALAYVRRQGASHIALMGHSNGAMGALGLLPEHASELDGLILLSGFNPNVDATGVSPPTLVLSGSADARFPATHFRQWTSELPGAEVIFLEGADHMLLVKRRQEFNRALWDFLPGLIGARPHPH